MKIASLIGRLFLITALAFVLAPILLKDGPGNAATTLPMSGDFQPAAEGELFFSVDGTPLNNQQDIQVTINNLDEKSCFSGAGKDEHIEVFGGHLLLRNTNKKINITLKEGTELPDPIVIVQQKFPLTNCGKPLPNGMTNTEIDLCVKSVKDKNGRKDEDGRYLFSDFKRFFGCSGSTHKIFWVKDKTSGQFALVIAQTSERQEKALGQLKAVLNTESKIYCEINKRELLDLSKVAPVKSCPPKAGPSLPHAANDLDNDNPKIDLRFAHETEKVRGRPKPISNLTAFVEGKKYDMVDPKDARFKFSPDKDGLLVLNSPNGDDISSYNGGLYVYYKIDNVDNVYRHELEGSGAYIQVKASEQLPTFTPNVDYSLDIRIFQNLSSVGALRDAHFYASRELNGDLRGEWKSEGEVKESGKFDVSASQTLKDNPPSEFYLRTTDGFLYKGTALKSGQSILFRVTELVSVPAHALAFFPLKYAGLKLETFMPDCLVLETAASGSLPLKGEREGKIAVVRANSENPISIPSKVTVKGCKFAAKEFPVTKDAVLHGFQNFQTAQETLKEENLPAEVFTFVAQRPRPHVMLVMGLSEEFGKDLGESRIQQFFGRIPQSFKKLDLSQSRQQLQFERAHVLMSIESGTGSNQYELIGGNGTGNGSLFAANDYIDKVMGKLTDMRFFIPTPTNIAQLQAYLPRNPVPSSTIVLFGGTASAAGGTCSGTKDTFRTLREGKDLHEKFAFVAVLKDGDQEPSPTAWDTSNKGGVFIYRCEAQDNVRVYFFRISDAVALSDRGQDVQERIFADIADWSPSHH